MIICGIDPGITGALAMIDTAHLDRVAIEDIPTAAKEINVSELGNIIRTWRPGLVLLERVSAMPGNGSVSMFNFGRSYGIMQGAVCALDLPLTLISPRVWKRSFNLNTDKEQARLYAIRMFPACAHHFKLKKHHNRAEAALLALHGAQNMAKALP